jgi:hypothetical protein
MFDLIRPWENAEPMILRGGTNDQLYLEWVLANAQEVFDANGNRLNQNTSVNLRHYLDRGGFVTATYTVRDWVVLGHFWRDTTASGLTYKAALVLSHQVELPTEAPRVRRRPHPYLPITAEFGDVSI